MRDSTKAVHIHAHKLSKRNPQSSPRQSTHVEAEQHDWHTHTTRVVPLFLHPFSELIFVLQHLCLLFLWPNNFLFVTELRTELLSRRRTTTTDMQLCPHKKQPLSRRKRVVCQSDHLLSFFLSFFLLVLCTKARILCLDSL